MTRAEQVAATLEGASLEEISEIAEALAASVVAEMPDPAEAARLFGDAVLRSAMVIRAYRLNNDVSSSVSGR